MSLASNFPPLFKSLQSGPLTFDAFMEMVLYDPEYGFYTQQQDIKNHFVTAPMLGKWLAMAIVENCLEFFPEFLDLGITEWGAGRGDLMFQIMSYLHELGHEVDYECIECSEQQKNHIQNKIKQLPAALQKRVNIVSSPSQTSGLILANEFLDALPFKRFSCVGDEVFEMGVTYQDGNLQHIKLPAESILKERVQALALRCGESGYVSEVSLNTETWLSSQLDAAQDAFFLIIDYGYLRSEYYHPERNSGTLQAIKKHEVLSDMLTHAPGSYDITAHVNFSALINLLEKQPYRYRTQREFLLASGVFDQLGDQLDPSQAGMIKTLLMPGQMGDVIKVFEVKVKSEET